jgi:hypothetical protein
MQQKFKQGTNDFITQMSSNYQTSVDIFSLHLLCICTHFGLNFLQVGGTAEYSKGYVMAVFSVKAIWGIWILGPQRFHSSELSYCGVLGYDTVTWRWVPMFERNIPLHLPARK